MTTERDRPAVTDEIEVTEEMIEAGTMELASYSESMEPDDDAVVRIFRAMIRAKNRSSSECGR
jgi:hypothetical protein